MSPHRLRLGATAGASALALALAGCASSDTDTPTTPGGDARLVVVASTNVYGAIAAAVGGDRVEVTSLITDPAADPHSYESTPADAAIVAGARLFVYNGGGYDEFAPQLAESAPEGARTVDVAALSGLEPAAPDGEEFNEHVWYSLPTVQALADTLAAELATASPADADGFTANAAAFNSEVDGLIAALEAIRSAHDGERVAITEPVPVYIVEAAGLQNATPEEFAEAVEEDVDPPAAVVAETLALFGTDPVRALVLNAQTRTPTTDQVTEAATAAGVPVVEVTETLPAGADDYVEWMTSQIDALAAALDRP